MTSVIIPSTPDQDDGTLTLRLFVHPFFFFFCHYNDKFNQKATIKISRSIWHWWFSGRILACHAGGPGSIPAQCISFLIWICLFNEAKNNGKRKRRYRVSDIIVEKGDFSFVSHVPRMTLVHAPPNRPF